MRATTWNVLCEAATWTRVRALMFAPLAAVALGLSACGDGGGIILTPPDDNPPPAACTGTTCGEVRIALTDGDGDFLSYAVDVVSLKLEKSNGTRVEALPTRQRVDFADLVDVSEFVTAATIPNGTYVKATIRLDYSDAEVTVESAGEPVAATVVDEDGNPLGVVDVEVTLDNANRVLIAPGTPRLLQLDFDLAATHDVDLATLPAAVTADPFLVASIEPLDARDFRVRGPLDSVDEAAGSYVVDLRPFNHPDARLGKVTVNTTADTTFEVDGAALDQAAGLAAMNALPDDAPTVALGTYDVDARSFTADRVLAGDSVPGADLDGIIGNVVAREGNDLFVRGGTLVRTDGEMTFARGEIRVRLGADTVVHEDGFDGTLGLDAISVGQRITALGSASASDTDPVLDATAGRVRLHRTHLSGTVVRTNTGQMDLDLFAIDGRDPAIFDFTGTGISPASDADPANYEVDTGSLDLDAFEPGEPARAFGFVTAFGAAPPDFEASALVDFDELRALLGLGWGAGGTSAPFLSMGENGFVIDTGNPDLGARHFVRIGPRFFDLTQLASPVTIEPVDSGRAVYAVVQRFRVDVFRDFGDFALRVNNLLIGGANMRSLTARGSFDEDDATLEANYVAVSFTAP